MTMYFDSVLWSWSTTPYIPKFWYVFSFHQLFGSTRWLAHQIPAPARATGTNAGTKNTKGWRNHKIYCQSMYGNLMVKSKRKQGIRFNKAKITVLRSWDKKGWIEYGWLHRHMLDHETPHLRWDPCHTLTSKYQSSHGWKHLEANMRRVFQVIFFQMFQMLPLRILKLQTCIVGPNGLLPV